jgi:tetratricopeptide (TPR) repeat protein
MYRYAMKTFIIALLWTFCNKSFAQAPASPASEFQEATEAYKKQDFVNTKLLLNKFLKNTPSSEAYFDLGLVYFETKQLGPAIANWRKAIEIDPSNQMAKTSLITVQKKIEHPELSRQADSFEILHQQLLEQLKVEQLFLLTAFLFASSSWLLISYFGERKRSLEQELPAPRLPWIGTALSLLFLASTALSAAKFYDMSATRATILTAKVDVLSAPDLASTSLFDLFEGLEVIIQDSQGDFYQISFPGGMTGWILKKNLMITSGSES